MIRMFCDFARRARTIVYLLICAALLPCPGAALVSEENSCGENVNWSLSSSGVLTITGQGPMADGCVITDEQTRAAVISITVRGGVTEIGAHAFEGMTAVSEIRIAGSVLRIGDYAFAGCSTLPAITIPASVTTIGAYALSDCSALNSVQLSGGITEISDGLFSGCSSLISFTPGSQTVRIGADAFHGCVLLSRIAIPSDVTDIGAGAFAGCARLERITVADGNTAYTAVDNILMNAGQSVLLAFPAGKTGTVYTVPATIAEIAPRAFSGCFSLRQVTIPANVETIGADAFSDCPQLMICSPNRSAAHAFATASRIPWIPLVAEVLDLPEGLVSIGPEAFAELDSADAVRIPSSVEVMDGTVFQNSDVVLLLPPDSPWKAWADERKIPWIEE